MLRPSIHYLSVQSQPAYRVGTPFIVLFIYYPYSSLYRQLKPSIALCWYFSSRFHSLSDTFLFRLRFKCFSSRSDCKTLLRYYSFSYRLSPLNSFLPLLRLTLNPVSIPNNRRNSVIKVSSSLRPSKFPYSVFSKTRLCSVPVGLYHSKSADDSTITNTMPKCNSICNLEYF